MATAAPVYDDKRMSIGRVFQRAASAVASNPIVTLGIALVIGAVPGFLVSILVRTIGMGSPATATAQFGATSMSAFIGATFVSSLIGLVIGAIVQGALTRAVVTANEGRRATFGDSLSTALRVFLPLIGLSILFSLGVTFGLILLIVPGIMLVVAWAVAVPALVVERCGVIDALRRSAELTKGSRWKIFGLFLILLVIYWFVSVVLGFVGFARYGATTPQLSIATAIASILLGTFLNLLWGAIQPSLYVELRQLREGEDVSHLEDVFA